MTVHVLEPRGSTFAAARLALTKTQQDASWRLSEVLRARGHLAGWPRRQEGDPVDDALCAMFEANRRIEAALERRIKALERRLLETLATDAMTSECRAEVIGTLASGQQRRLTDAKLLAPAEQQIVDDYRSMAPCARDTVRALFAQLSGRQGGLGASAE